MKKVVVNKQVKEDIQQNLMLQIFELQSFGRTSWRPTEIIIADLMERLNAKAFPQVRNGAHATE